MEKICKICGISKPIDEFRKDAKMIEGYQNHCKACLYEYNKKWLQTEEGVIRGIYYHQNDHSKSRGHHPPSYTLDELRDWIYNQPNWNKLYNNWVASGYDKWEKPSIDRLDNSKGYLFGNIQLTTWRINYKNAKEDQKSGRIRSSTSNRSVIQLTKSGEFIDEYHSIKEAERQTNIDFRNISATCCNKRKSAGGFRWEYSQIKNM